MHTKKLVALLLSAMFCLQMLPATSLAAESADSSISGNGVRVTYAADSHAITLYRLEGTDAVQMSKPSDMGYPIIAGQPVRDFAVDGCDVETGVTGVMGAGERMTITSHSPSTGLVRTYVLETSETVEGGIYTATTYQAGDAAVTADWFVDNEFELYGAQDRVWSFHGGGEGPMHYNDNVRKIDLTDNETFSRENRQDWTAAAVPVSDIYLADGGITVGDASATRRELHTPVQETADSVQVAIQWRGKTIAAGESFVNVHRGDYYMGLRGYKNALGSLGIVMQSNIPARSYELRWDAWGWSTDWTVDLIIGKLDELQAAGVKQIAVDDGWFNHGGDWQLNPSKFPNGDADMLRLTQAIHDHGMTAILWWRPCDGGKDNSTLHREHPEYYVMNENGTTAKLGSPGKSDPTQWSADAGYALCPASEGAIAIQVAFVNRAMNDWNFDGFKGDYVWSLPKCYNPDHNHPYPEDSTERQAEFYRTTYEAMVANDPEVFNLLCNCGAPQDLYSLPYMTQVVTSDPTSLDQTRTRVKMFKALMGDDYPVTTDHNQSWYSTAVGTGAVLIEKSAFSGAQEAEYERWLNIANTVQLHKGTFIGDLYSYGFDPYETYVVEKDGVMYYAFYRDGGKYRPSGYPDIELKGLDPDKMYRIVDYVNNNVVATNLMGDNAVFNYKFSKDLLVKAVELAEPDDPSIVDPDWGYATVDDRDPSVTYTGNWVDDSNPGFHEGTARYTNTADSAVEFTFAGTSIRWYGQKDTNFGTADVYLDGALKATVSAKGSADMGVRLFEALDLPAAWHTIKIVNRTGVIDVDHFAYQEATPEVVYEKVDALSGQITYTGTWQTDHDDAFYMGNAMSTTEEGAYAEMTFQGTAVQWYGQTMTAFGVAMVYLDGELAETVFTYGPESAGNLLFEKTGLTPGEHTIRIVHSSKFIDLDYLAYGDVPAKPTPGHEFHDVDAMDPALVYTGAWNDDQNPGFHESSARYTSETGASVEYAFTGTMVRWYGQNDTNFGTARVYLDGALVETVNVNGPAAMGQLLFESAELTAGPHTIRIECASRVIDIDYLSYAA